MPRPFGRHSMKLWKAFTTRQGLLGNYDYASLFKPNIHIPFTSWGSKNRNQPSPFFGLDDSMPVVLALLLGLQHALAMLAGIIAPPIILGGAGGANLRPEEQQYLVSTALIVSGLLSSVQITRFRIYKTRFHLGTGLISVVGVSFTIIPIAQGAFSQMYAAGFCPSGPEDSSSPSSSRLPCPRGYGALIGTSALASLIEILLSFIPPRLLLRMFPPIVTGPTVMLIGLSLIKAGFTDWLGGSGPCSAFSSSSSSDASSRYSLCPHNGAPHALPWGSPEFLGLGFSVFLAIILCERFGSPLMKSASVALGLLTGCVIAAATGYFDNSGISSAPVASFIWLHTFPLSVYPPLLLPLIIVYVVCATEAIGDITATCDVSMQPVTGKLYESRIQGGILADGLGGCLSALMTLTPLSTLAQNNGVIALTRCANRSAGYACCFLLVLMGIFAKFAAALVAIPASVLGGMTTFLFCSVSVSGLAIISRGVPFTRRNRFILTAGLALGYGATLVPTYFDRVFPSRPRRNSALEGFLDAITLIMETGMIVTAAVCMILNLMLSEEVGEISATSDLDGSTVKTVKGAQGGDGLKTAEP